MHSCWTCLFGYTTNANYTGNSVAFCDWVKQLFITEAANEEDGVADLAFSQVDTERMQDSDVDLEFSQVDAWPMKQVFETVRASLHKACGGVPPTPVMVLRRCAEVAGFKDAAENSQAKRPRWGTPAGAAPKEQNVLLLLLLVIILLLLLLLLLQPLLLLLLLLSLLRLLLLLLILALLLLRLLLLLLLLLQLFIASTNTTTTTTNYYYDYFYYYYYYYHY